MSERYLPTTPDDPHRGQPLVTSGAPLRAADAAVVLLHGRGESAESVTRVAEEFYRHGVAFLAPQAAKYTWYPRRFDAPVEANEPWLSSGVDAVANAVDTATDAGLAPEDVVLFGFSQGACLAAEYLARRPRRYGGAFVLAGALPGRPGARDHAGSLDETPVFCGVGTGDPEVDVAAVERTRDALAAMDGDVTLETYDAAHRITDGEIAAVESRLDDLLA